jgi:hypothetical protein
MVRGPKWRPNLFDQASPGRGSSEEEEEDIFMYKTPNLITLYPEYRGLST